MTTKDKKFRKKKHLRNNEYYDMQEEFDKLYEQSKNKRKFKHLLEIIESEQKLEPICEAKFHKDNYGFRPNRNTHHAIEQNTLI